jgi:hypothetical protein
MEILKLQLLRLQGIRMDLKIQASLPLPMEILTRRLLRLLAILLLDLRPMVILTQAKCCLLMAILPRDFHWQVIQMKANFRCR